MSTVQTVVLMQSHWVAEYLAPFLRLLLSGHHCQQPYTQHTQDLSNDKFSQLSAMDVSAQATMKGAAKCDKHCELQNSANQQIFERILRCQDIPDSMPASVSVSISYSNLSS